MVELIWCHATECEWWIAVIMFDVTECYKCIPLWWNCKFWICIEGTKSVSRCNSELLKLQLRVIGTSDIEGMKPTLRLLSKRQLHQHMTPNTRKRETTCNSMLADPYVWINWARMRQRWRAAILHNVTFAITRAITFYGRPTGVSDSITISETCGLEGFRLRVRLHFMVNS